MKNKKIRKNKVYLDTSVPSAYLDNQNLERRKLTREFWYKLRNYEIYISKITIKELKQIKDNKVRRNILKLVKNFKKLALTQEAKILGKEYIKNKIIPKKFEADAFHIAITSVNEIDFLVSWNFKHIVNIRTKRLVNFVNVKEGYRPIEIVAPPEL